MKPNSRRAWVLFSIAMSIAACTKRANVCTKDSDCMDPSYPFCDVNGEYLPSGGEKNVCTIVPDNCPISRCGCSPGAVLACSGDQLTTCASDGMSSTTASCPLACASDGTRCSTFMPSNGLGDALAMSAGAPDVVIPAGARIDTDTGVVVDGNGTPVEVMSVVVNQLSGPAIRAFYAHSLMLDDATVLGSNALGLVGAAGVTLQGKLDLSAHGTVSGSGGEGQPFGAAAAPAVQSTCLQGSTLVTQSPGGGGGGNAVMGGTSRGPVGGSAVTSFGPLYGGGRGGDLESSSAAVIAMGGGGGGAVEIVSATQVTLTARGFVSLGGGGGQSSGGGGAGGTAIIEAPIVDLQGNLTGITANGGGGGGCGQIGHDATTTLSATTAPSCPGTKYDYSAGAGGTALVAPQNTGACINGPCSSCDSGSFGGAGGAAGRLRVATRDGTFGTTGTPTMSVAISTATLTAQ